MKLLFNDIVITMLVPIEMSTPRQEDMMTKRLKGMSGNLINYDSSFVRTLYATNISRKLVISPLKQDAK